MHASCLCRCRECMDSKEVTKAINSKIRPFLKGKGFKNYSGRTYWRYGEDQIDILNFQSFNSYNADVIGCTTYSFALNLAVTLNYIPFEHAVKEKNGLSRPEEYQGHFRKHITKGLQQSELERKDIWYVQENGTNLTEVIEDAGIQIAGDGLGWFEQFDSKQNVLKILTSDNEEDMNGTWGFGNLNSPNRNRLTGFTALKLGQHDLAIEKFKQLKAFYLESFEQDKYDYHKDQADKVQSWIDEIKLPTT